MDPSLSASTNVTLANRCSHAQYGVNAAGDSNFGEFPAIEAESRHDYHARMREFVANAENAWHDCGSFEKSQASRAA